MMQASRRTHAPLHLGLAAATLGLLATPITAQNLSLDKTGGALGATVSFAVAGQPTEAYVVLLSVLEAPTPVPSLGITLDIDETLVGLSYRLPGFVGFTNGSGLATASAIIPNEPFLQSLVISAQVVAGNGPFRVSNLVRLTPQASGTFVNALNQPAVPVLGGGTAAAPNNELLFVGGSGPVAQRYKSRTEEWELAGASFGIGLLGQTTGLADGRVLFTGGIDLTTGQPTTAAAVYDPATQTTTTLAMAVPRAGHGASLMSNGRVLVSGGSANVDFTNPLSLFTGLQVSTELFDPVTNTFLPGPNMLEARAFHTSTTLTTGRVLVAGGIALLPIVNIPNVSSTAYLFNPATNSFGLPSVMSGARFLHSATPLSNGRVLIAGGLTLDLTQFLQTGQIQDLIIGTRTDCQLFAQGGFFGTFTTVNGLQVGRAGAAIAPLPNGSAIIAGGFQMQIDIATSTFVLNATATADRFTQGPNLLTPVGSMAAPRLFPTTVNLPDGTVMIVGGGPTNAEIYQN